MNLAIKCPSQKIHKALVIIMVVYHLVLDVTPRRLQVGFCVVHHSQEDYCIWMSYIINFVQLMDSAIEDLYKVPVRMVSFDAFMDLLLLDFKWVLHSR